MQDIQTQLATGKKHLNPAEQNQVVNLRTDISGLEVVSKNIGEGNLLTKVATTNLDQISNLTTKLNELALEASSDSKTTEQKSALQQQFVEIRSQLKSLIDSAEYNGNNLLKGDKELSIHTGINASDKTALKALNLDEKLEDIYNLDISDDAEEALTVLNTSLDSISSGSGMLSTYSFGLDTRGTSVKATTADYKEILSSIEDANIEQLTVELNELNVQNSLQMYAIGANNKQVQSLLQLLG